jgi:HSP20 family protein
MKYKEGCTMFLIPRRSFFRDDFDDFFDFPISNSNVLMKSDIYEEGNNYVIEIDLPGFKKEDVTINYDKGYLTIEAKKEETKEEKKNYVKRERYYGEFKRSFYVGDIDDSLIKAKFEDGILKINFPKKELENKKLIDIE